jgi:HNH endonuclease
MTLPSKIIEEVRRRAGCACEYCFVTEDDTAGRLTVDHYRPQAQGGTDDLENLLLPL